MVCGESKPLNNVRSSFLYKRWKPKIWNVKEQNHEYRNLICAKQTKINKHSRNRTTSFNQRSIYTLLNKVITNILKGHVGL